MTRYAIAMILRILALLLSLNVATSGASTREERDIGRDFARQLYQSADIETDPVLLGALSRLTLPLIQASEWRDEPLYLILIDNPELNAFAAPGGVIGVHTGLFSAARQSDQVASVLAHEIAHLTQRHFGRRQEDSKRLQAAYLAGTLVALAAGLGGDPTLGTATLSATQAATIDQVLSFSRAHEREADQLGLELLAKAGHDPAAMVGMFKRMQDQQRLSSQPLPYLSTHPVSVERIADTQARTGKTGAEGGDAEFSYWLSRIGTPSATQSGGDRVGYQQAIEAALTAQDWDGVVAIASDARFSFPNDLAIGVWEAQALDRLDRTADALARLEALSQHHRALAQPYVWARDMARLRGWTPEFNFYAGMAAIRQGDSDEAQRFFNSAASQGGAIAARAKAQLRALEFNHSR
ncbi:M48 family metalloprotease [Litorivicinus lipolyticus]|uniref:M48 family metalloprotease n=2 Tax=Litorivicinus lipolyticus TaxID=418701 RepID=A0A5Q2Q6R7_9GAMM|nr:M48 family metalloprotease [Litorivicinus lipolyticus]